MTKYALLFLSVFLLSCNKEGNHQSEKIRVTGEGKIRVKPDLVILTLSVSFTKPRMVDAVRATQETIDSVVSILEKFSTNENDIKTSSISANKEYSYNTRTPVFIGFQAEQSNEFVLNDIQKFTELTGRLLETKITSISHIQFGHSKSDSLFREADLLAYDDALKSAKKLCNRANVKLGKLTFMTNVQGKQEYGTDNHMYEEINTYSKGFGGRGFKISPEVLEFKRTLISEYEIE